MKTHHRRITPGIGMRAHIRSGLTSSKLSTKFASKSVSAADLTDEQLQHRRDARLKREANSHTTTIVRAQLKRLSMETKGNWIQEFQAVLRQDKEERLAKSGLNPLSKELQGCPGATHLPYNSNISKSPQHLEKYLKGLESELGPNLRHNVARYPETSAKAGLWKLNEEQLKKATILQKQFVRCTRTQILMALHLTNWHAGLARERLKKSTSIQRKQKGERRGEDWLLLEKRKVSLAERAKRSEEISKKTKLAKFTLSKRKKKKEVTTQSAIDFDSNSNDLYTRLQKDVSKIESKSNKDDLKSNEESKRRDYDENDSDDDDDTSLPIIKQQPNGFVSRLYKGPPRSSTAFFSERPFSRQKLQLLPYSPFSSRPTTRSQDFELGENESLYSNLNPFSRPNSQHSKNPFSRPASRQKQGAGIFSRPASRQDGEGGQGTGIFSRPASRQKQDAGIFSRPASRQDGEGGQGVEIFSRPASRQNGEGAVGKVLLSRPTSKQVDTAHEEKEKSLDEADNDSHENSTLFKNAKTSKHSSPTSNPDYNEWKRNEEIRRKEEELQERKRYLERKKKRKALQFNKNREAQTIEQRIIAASKRGTAHDINTMQQLIKKLPGHVDTCREPWTSSTPLHLASQWNHLKIVKILLENNASPNAKDRWKRTPLDLARQHGKSHAKISQLLLEYGSEKGKLQKMYGYSLLQTVNQDQKAVERWREMDLEVLNSGLSGHAGARTLRRLRRQRREKLWKKNKLKKREEKRRSSPITRQVRFAKELFTTELQRNDMIIEV
eukprot:g2866.t1